MKGIKEVKKHLTPQVVMLIAFALLLGIAAGYYFGYDVGFEKATGFSGK